MKPQPKAQRSSTTKRNVELDAAGVTAVAGEKRNALEHVAARVCVECRGPMPVDARTDAERCSARCRMKASRRRKAQAEREAWANRPPRSCCFEGPCCCVAKPMPLRGGPNWKAVRG